MTDSPANSEVSYSFTSLAGAVEALLSVLEHARKTDDLYSFTGLTPDRILSHGLHLSGEVADISQRLDSIEGALRNGS